MLFITRSLGIIIESIVAQKFITDELFHKIFNALKKIIENKFKARARKNSQSDFKNLILEFSFEGRSSSFFVVI